MAKTVDYSINSYHENKYGPFTILECLGSDRTNHGVNYYSIKFIETGYEREVTSSASREACIVDPYFPQRSGIGRYGIPKMEKGPILKTLYLRWCSMIDRCYSPKHKHYCYYGALGVSVCYRWTCFEYYVDDVQLLPGYDKFLKNPKHYQLDKDTLQANIPINQRVYSPTTCIWIESRLNMREVYNNQYNNVTGFFGVVKLNEGYERYAARIYHNNHNFTIGVYDNPAIAAGAYNNFINIYYPYMPLNEGAIKITEQEEVELDLRKNKTEMCRIINKKNS